MNTAITRTVLTVFPVFGKNCLFSYTVKYNWPDSKMLKSHLKKKIISLLVKNKMWAKKQDVGLGKEVVSSWKVKWMGKMRGMDGREMEKKKRVQLQALPGLVAGRTSGPSH